MSDRQGPVVVGVDGSEGGEAALAWAGDQAAATGAALEIVTAWDWPHTYGWAAPVSSDFDPAREAARLVAESEAAVRAAHPGVAVSGTVAQGPAPLLLVDASRRARLLVVGSRGHGAFAGMVLGSVSQHCVTHAHCPVVVTRGEGARHVHEPAAGTA